LSCSVAWRALIIIGAAADGDQGVAAAMLEERSELAPVEQRQDLEAAHQAQCIIACHRSGILQEDARSAGSAGGRPHNIAIMEALTDTCGISDKRFDIGTHDGRIGDPFVEVRHQLRLDHGWQSTMHEGGGRDIGIEAAIIGGTNASEVHQGVEPFLLALADEVQRSLADAPGISCAGEREIERHLYRSSLWSQWSMVTVVQRKWDETHC
jgi:hypothetical protein